MSTFNFQRTVYPSRDPAPTMFPSLHLGNKRKTRSFIILLLVGGHERGENSSMRGLKYAVFFRRGDIYMRLLSEECVDDDRLDLILSSMKRIVCSFSFAFGDYWR